MLPSGNKDFIIIIIIIIIEKVKLEFSTCFITMFLPQFITYNNIDIHFKM